MNQREQIELLDTCMCRLTELYGEWAKQHGISYNTMNILYSLNKGTGCTQKQIAEEWMIPKQTVNSTVKNLERNGYICFETAEGKKEKRILLTETGKAYADHCLKGLYEIEDRSMGKIGERMRNALVESSLAYTEAFEKELRNER